MDNRIVLSGKVARCLDEIVMIDGIGYQEVSLEVEKKSKEIDQIPIYVPEGWLIKDGMYYFVRGQLRLFEISKEGKCRYEKAIFANVFESEREPKGGVNFVAIKGSIVKKGILGETKIGKKVINFTLQSESEAGNLLYVHCVAWQENARKAEKLCLGDSVQVIGRIRSKARADRNVASINDRKKLEISVSDLVKRMN